MRGISNPHQSFRSSNEILRPHKLWIARAQMAETINRIVYVLRNQPSVHRRSVCLILHDVENRKARKLELYFFSSVIRSEHDGDIRELEQSVVDRKLLN